MEKKLLLLLCIWSLAVLLLAGCGKKAETSAEIMEKALSDGKPALVQFGTATASCYPCVAMKAVFGELEEKYGDRLSIINIDVDIDREITAEYRVMMIPTQVIFNSDGEEIFRHTGYIGTDEIIVYLQETGLE